MRMPLALLLICGGTWTGTIAIASGAVTEPGVREDAAAGANAGSKAPDLDGCWYGNAILGGRATPVTLGLQTTEGKLRATLGLPVIGATSIPVGEVGVEADRLRVASMELARDGGGILRGRLPASVDPADELPVTFRRTPWLEPDCATPRAKPDLVAGWMRDLDGGVWADPVLDGRRDRLVVGTLAGTVTALDAGTGEPAWSFRAGGSIRSAPRLRGDRVFVIADDGHVRCLDATDGAVRWDRAVAAATEPAHPAMPGADYHYRGHQLLLAGDVLLVGTLEGALLRLDAASGEERARIDLGSAVTALAATDGALYAATWDGELRRLSPSLEEAWRFEARGTIHGDLLATAAGVVLGDRGYYVHALDPDTGEARWSRKIWFSWVESGAILDEGALLVGSSDARTVRALDPIGGAELWVTPVGGRALPAPVAGGSFLVQGVSAERGYIATMAPALVILDPVTGRELVRLSLPLPDRGHGGIVARPVVAADAILFATVTGTVARFRLAPP
jgi:outer membrane protein assembly factor BamB